MDFFVRNNGIHKFPTINWMLCMMCIWLLVLIGCNESATVATIKRNASPEYNLENNENSADKLNVNYDEYPVRMILVALIFLV